MKFTVKKKRDGQGWNNFNEINATSWQDAKQQFTEMIRETAANEDGYIYHETEEECEDRFGEGMWEGSGYYPDYSADIILDDQLIYEYREDVYMYTINKVD